MFRKLCNLLATPSKRRARRASQALAIESLEPRQLLAADLTLDNLSLVEVEPNGANVHIASTLVVVNSGDIGLIANDVHLEGVLSTDAVFGNADDVLLDLDLLDLNLIPGTIANGSISGNVSLAEYQAANFLIIRVDPDDAVNEENELNNQTLLFVPQLPTFDTSPGQTVGKTNRAVRVDPNISFADSPAQPFNGAQLHASVENDAGDDNILSIKRIKTDKGILRRRQNELQLGGEVIGTINGGTNTQPLVITFNANVNVDDVEMVASAVSLRGKKGVAGVRNVQFYVSEATIVTGFIAEKQVVLV